MRFGRWWLIDGEYSFQPNDGRVTKLKKIGELSIGSFGIGDVLEGIN